VIKWQSEGFTATAHALGRLQAGMLDLEPAWEEVDRVLEEGEKRLFEGWHGKFVDTGRLEDSLTQDGGDAIRLHHSQEFQFGTAVHYARYQRDPNDRSESAVLKLTGDEIVATGVAVMTYLMSAHGSPVTP
jgi:hypothetical protein